MTAHECLTIAFILSLVVTLFASLRLLQKRSSPCPECTRKLMHVGSGLISLSLPWLVDRAETVLLLSLLAFAGLIAMRYCSALRGLHSVIGNVPRRSVGELCIPVAAAFLFVASDGDVFLYSMPLLAMTFADSAAALVGQRLGQITLANDKTVEGSFAFFAVCFLATDVCLFSFGGCGGVEAMLLSMLFAALLAAIEAASALGLDNLFVPVGGFVILRLFGRMNAGQLALAVALIAAVLALGFFSRIRPVLRGRFTI